MKQLDKKQIGMSLCHGAVLPDSASATTNLSALLKHAASSNKGMIFCSGDKQGQADFLSYSDLFTEAQRILNSLRLLGLKPQDLVLLQIQDPHYFLACLWGCFLGGFVPIPMGVEPDVKSQGDSKLYQTWELCDSPLVITDVQQNKNFTVAKVNDLLANEPDAAWHCGSLDDLALLLFTSGSTGKPKGVKLSVRNLLASIYGMARVNQLNEQDITLNWMPLEHVASLVMFHLTEVYLGCQQIQVKSELILQNPLQWLNLIHEYRVTATWSPNFAYNLVNDRLQDTALQSWDLSCLRWMGNGAEAVVGQTTQRFLELLEPYGLSPTVVSPGYGMSETCSGIAHSHDFYLHLDREFVSVGAPIPGVSLRIVNDDDNLLPEGEIGLLQVQGATVTTGYYRQPELDNKVFTVEGWFNTGDLGFLQNGQLTITGRQKDVIIINGINYFNHEIETVVEAIPGISISYTAACGVKDRYQQEQIAIFFHSTEQESESLYQLVKQIRKGVFEQLGVTPTYIIPVTKETIPKTAIGKIQRSQLCQRFAAGEFDTIISEIEKLIDQRDLSQQELPETAIEQNLVTIWQSVLNLKTVGVKDNFFELGGNSLLLMQVLSELTSSYHSLSAVTLFQYATIKTLANYLNSHQESGAKQQGQRRGKLRRQAIGNKDVAIIGMSCRFPGANNLEEFWHNLSNGVESISWFEDQEILDTGVDRELLNNPNYVKASPILEDIEAFDADFWGYSPKEARLLDPQQRLFMECAWESLEDAGYDPMTYSGEISLYGGAATNTYLLNNIYPHRHTIDRQDDLRVINLSSMGGFQVTTANDKDYLTTRTSYKLNLQGSSVNVQTACSTSLVTVHLACQSLLNSECDLALAGGVSVHSPQKMGYLHQEGMILSPDGHCRAFDAAAAGTIFGSGAGIVVLKLLDRAIEDGDRIYGVIKGSATNNDGGSKVGYLAPNVDGQTRVVAEALAFADISPQSVGYVEAHGTGTKLGDPIEITALSQAYQDDTRKSGYCAVGSVKTNVGHLQMASGIVGLIKTTLCLYHRQIAPSLHFQQPNPQIDFANSPFYINTQLQDWQEDQKPRRAGVNSLGIGGTNAHVILEEFIPPNEEVNDTLPAYLLTLSAKNKIALTDLVSNYQEYLAKYPDVGLQDICFTSNIGRHHFDYRLGLVARDKSELAAKLSEVAKLNPLQNHHKIAFLFTGQGSQYVGMGQQLYDIHSGFKNTVDRCLKIIRPYYDKSFLRANSRSPLWEYKFDLNQTEYTQPLLFIIEYSLAQLWLSWGIKPEIMLGHSLGEYVAAAIAGVFSLESALKLVSARAKLMQSLPDNGTMLAVFTCRDQINNLLTKNIYLAADNGSHLVLSGLKTEIKQIARELDSLGIKNQFLNVSHGFHSPLMKPMIEEFKVVAQTIDYSLPQIPIVSNATGNLADETIATPDYWLEHIIKPVLFTDSIKYLQQKQVNIFLEIGVKPTLITMAQSILDHRLFLPSLDSRKNDWQQLLEILAQLYIAGEDINWTEVNRVAKRNKISLPTYPFQRQKYWFDLHQLEPVSYSNQYEESSLEKTIHPLLGKPIYSPIKQTIYQSYLQPETINWLQDHRFNSQVIFPGTAYLEMAIAAGVNQLKTTQLTLKDISITSPLIIDTKLDLIPEIQFIYTPESDLNSWEIYSSDGDQWQLHCAGKLGVLNPEIEITEQQLAAIKLKFNHAELDIQQHYLQCQQRGINYGKNFQGIKQLWKQDNQALGFIELPTDIDSKQYHVHPALLDACLQILFAALPAELATTGYIPVALEQLDVCKLPPRRVWSYLKLNQDNIHNKIISADVWLYSDRGELIIKLSGLKSQRVNSQPHWHDWLYQQQWIKKPVTKKSSVLNKTGNWLIFANSTAIGDQLATLLKSQQQLSHIITRNSAYDFSAAFKNLIQQQSDIAGIIYLWSLDTNEDWQECQSYLYLVQAIIEHAASIPLWFVTHNAQPVNNDQLTSGIRQSCLWGMQKAIALEYPDLLCVGIDFDSLDNSADNIFQEICARENEQVGYRHNQRYVARLVRSDILSRDQISNGDSETYPENNLQLQLNSPGNLDSLSWQATTRKSPEANEIEIEVKTTGLNFRDVMVALNLYPDDTRFLGLECSGIVTKVGTAVTNFQPGDEVMAISDCSFSQYLTVNSLLAINKPLSLSDAEAATIPVTFLTAYYTLVHLAQLQPGEKILIHAAAGGVGLAAIQIAQQRGAEVFTTASPPKWSLLKSLGVTKIMNSRSLDFANEIMSATNGQGVDVVLNSLAGEFMTKSLGVLNNQGHFIEIGKQGIWSPADVAKLRPSVKYSVVDLWQITQNNPQLIQQMLFELRSQFVSQYLKPLPHKVFPRDNTIAAFRYMQQGKHQGKIIISIETQIVQPSKGESQFTPTHITGNGTYLITGGMGAIGLHLAEWLTTKGIKNLVLIGRSDVKPEQKASLEKLQETVQVNLIKADIADTNQLAQALLQIESDLPPLKGIIHCAGVTSDRPLLNQDWSSFSQVLAPKVQGVWNLHQLTQKYDLDNFILFSSASSLIGSAGQANYCAANAFLDTLAHARRSLGLPAISINWGAWQNTGLASNNLVTARLKQQGIGSIEPQRAIAILEQLLLNPPPQIGVIPINWQVWQQHHHATAFFANFIESEAKSKADNSQSNLKQKLLTADIAHRQTFVTNQIIEELTNILGIKDFNLINIDDGFSELGLDSLASIELKNKIQSSFDLKLSSTDIFDYSSVRKFAKYLTSIMFKEESKAKNDNNYSLKQDKDFTRIDALSDAEAEALLLVELDNIDV